jgi:hypothetical protein
MAPRRLARLDDVGHLGSRVGVDQSYLRDAFQRDARASGGHDFFDNLGRDGVISWTASYVDTTCF